MVAHSGASAWQLLVYIGCCACACEATNISYPNGRETPPEVPTIKVANWRLLTDHN